MTGYEAFFKLQKGLIGEAKLKCIDFSDDKDEMQWDRIFINLTLHILQENDNKEVKQ